MNGWNPSVVHLSRKSTTPPPTHTTHPSFMTSEKRKRKIGNGVKKWGCVWMGISPERDLPATQQPSVPSLVGGRSDRDGTPPSAPPEGTDGGDSHRWGFRVGGGFPRGGGLRPRTPSPSPPGSLKSLTGPFHAVGKKRAFGNSRGAGGRGDGTPPPVTEQTSSGRG